jgi:cell division protein FtsI/penicillin-binding protein 2
MTQKSKNKRRRRAKGYLLLSAIAVGIFVFFAAKPTQQEVVELKLKNQLDERVHLADVLGDYFRKETFPTDVKIRWDGSDENLKVQYTFEPDLQQQAERLLKQYKPDYGAIVMMDATTGRILAMYSSQKDDSSASSLALRATYPAASVFKIVTATAAIDKAGIHPSDTIRFNGGNYTLYKKNVLSDKITRWTRSISLKEAFARSINTAFGRLSLEHLTPEMIEEYAKRYMFNQKIPSDLPVEMGVATVPDEKGFELAEVSSGYNKMNRMSPVQGAMIAAAVINDGHMVVPYIVDSLKNEKGETIYKADLVDSGPIMKLSSSEKVQELMEQTVTAGTSRKSFRELTRNRQFREIAMGGKTGHLTGDNPKGRVDWFVGYAGDGDRRISVAAITVNKEKWTVKSAYLGQQMIKKAFEPSVRAKVATTRN